MCGEKLRQGSLVFIPILTNDISPYIIPALMSDLLPKYINPWLLFRQNERVSGTLDLSEMTHLCASQIRQSGEVQATLSVVERDDGHTVIRGEASAELELECQRCLRPLVKTFVAPFELVLVKYEHQLSNVNDDDDALVVEESLTLAPLIEQELILALPMIAKHDDCQLHYDNTPSEVMERQQPFANLKDLLS